MKKLIFTTSILIFLWSCSEKKTKEHITNTEKNEQKSIESEPIPVSDETVLKSKDSIQQETTTNIPCTEIQEFVIDMESLNWVSDTNRLIKAGLYRELNRKEIKYFGERPFYTISFEDSRLNKAYSSGMYESHFDSLDLELFQGVQSIWGYFYKDKTATGMISDGVIEQWEFESEQQADKALRQILQPGFIVYFNTNPFYCRIKNKLIIFQTRAMAFSLNDQMPLFEKFVEEKAPITASP